MKNNKSPESTLITPTKKGLKQARLPFKPISGASPKPTRQARKRKLSDPEEVTAGKIVKISKENDNSVISDSPVVIISDDDSKDGSGSESSQNKIKFNPYVKLIDNVLNKKMNRNKNTEKHGKKSSNTCKNSDIEASRNDELIGTNKEMTEKDDVINNMRDPDNSIHTIVTPKKVPRRLQKSTSPVNESDCVNLENAQHLKQTSNNRSTIKKVSESSMVAFAPPCVKRKRSSRKEAEVKEDNLDSSSCSSKINESISSTSSTPRQSRSSSVTNSQGGDDSLNNSRNVTPKQAKNKLESAKSKEEIEKEKLEKEMKRQQEKDERAKRKQEKEEQKRREREEKEEAKKKEKEEKEEQRRKEKEEKERQKELERKEKEEQKRKEKEEKELQKRKEKEAKEEEKRKKQEAAQLEREEEELKKKKAAKAFVNFFVPKEKIDKNEKTVEISKNFLLSNFTIKADMRLAPTTRHSLTDDNKIRLEALIGEQNKSESELYVKALRKGNIKPQSSGKTWPSSDKNDDDVIIVEDELPPLDGFDALITSEPTVRENLHPKLLSFHENRRPPYFGTWRKKSSFIKPRRPFGQDQRLLDYEVDSDEEWEEEQEGESIDGSAAGSEDEQEADEYEVDNEVFVPHGYLSDEEATMDGDDVLSMSPETQKRKLKFLEEEFESELRKPTEVLKPRLYGLLWAKKDGSKPDNCVDVLANYFNKLSVIMNDPTPFMQPPVDTEDAEKKKVKKKKARVDGEKKVTPKQEKGRKAAVETEPRTRKLEKKVVNEPNKNQPGINAFLTKRKPS